MKVVIMAGGKGTRVSSVASDIPKPMIKIDGTPVLEREIKCLKEQGFEDIIITVGYLGHIIMNYFGDESDFGLHIEYFVEEQPLGNAGALFELKNKLTEDFLLLNADAIFDIDFDRIVKFHKEKDGLVTLFTHPNSHPYDNGLIIADKTGAVEQWLTKEDARPKYYQNRVNAGLHVVSPEVLSVRPEGAKVDLDRQILKPLAGTGKMFCYDSPEYVKDMGTPDRYEVSLFWSKSAKNAVDKLVREEKPDIVIGDMVRSTDYIKDIEAFRITDLDDRISLRYQRQLDNDLNGINPYGAFLNTVPSILQRIMLAYFVIYRKNIMRMLIVSRKVINK